MTDLWAITLGPSSMTEPLGWRNPRSGRHRLGPVDNSPKTKTLRRFALAIVVLWSAAGGCFGSGPCGNKGCSGAGICVSPTADVCGSLFCQGQGEEELSTCMDALSSACSNNDWSGTVDCAVPLSPCRAGTSAASIPSCLADSGVSPTCIAAVTEQARLSFGDAGQ